ncbi:unnamed protein product [Cladocopium goreaui]|uniref:Uncharacterized protein n=1 Tax=Cladocopium goreaui TaxID=2562237 RepID=A0A9P1C2N1_9DINO|nr:unnamed protein product [Cladocopium goreaui]
MITGVILLSWGCQYGNLHQYSSKINDISGFEHSLVALSFCPGAPKARTSARTPQVQPTESGGCDGHGQVTEVMETELDQIQSEITRLQAENASLRQLLKARPRSWKALLEELPNGYDVAPDHLQIQCLKEELCNTVERRRRLEHAVRARHQGLQRAMCSEGRESLQQALADGAAMVEAERLQEQSGHEAGRSQSRGRRPSPGGHHGVPQPRRSWTASEVLDVEQLVFDTAMSLMAVDGWAQQLAARLRVASRDLLRHARDLPESKVSTAALRRKLRRHQVFHQTAVVGAEMQETGPVAQAPVELPNAVLKALGEALEAAKSERAARQEVETLVARLGNNPLGCQSRLVDVTLRGEEREKEKEKEKEEEEKEKEKEEKEKEKEEKEKEKEKEKETKKEKKKKKKKRWKPEKKKKKKKTVPCGIFTDELRVQAMMEDASTIRKSVVQAQELHKARTRGDWKGSEWTAISGRMVRWIATKEEHAQKIMTTTVPVAARKGTSVKKADLDQDEYLKRLALHHDVMVAAMKAKQSSELGPVDTLDAAIQALAPIYSK